MVNVFIQQGNPIVIMSGESIAQIIGIIILSVLMLIFSFIFSERGEGTVSLILLFVSIALAFILVFYHFGSKKSSN